MYEALAAQMTRIIALMALTALGLPGAPVHQPVHDQPQRALRSVTIRRGELRDSEWLTTAACPAVCAQEQIRLRHCGLPGLRLALPHMVDMPVIVRHQDRGALRLDHRHDQALCRARRASDL